MLEAPALFEYFDVIGGCRCDAGTAVSPAEIAEQKILPHRIEPIKYSGELGQPNLQARSP